MPFEGDYWDLFNNVINPLCKNEGVNIETLEGVSGTGLLVPETIKYAYRKLKPNGMD